MKSTPALLCSLALALSASGATTPAPAAAETKAAPAAAIKAAAALDHFVAVSLTNPRAGAGDAAGNLYIGDFTDGLVYRITPAGKVTSWGGAAGAGPFQSPSGLAVDATGNIFVADIDGGAVHRIAPDGKITTVASATGTASDGLISGPISVATDAAGNAYVANNGSSSIAKVTPAGIVTIFAGKAGESGSTDGTGTAARLATPRGIASDPAGNLYVADEGNSNIRKITPAGVVTTLAGKAGDSGSKDGTGTAASFGAPRGLAADAAGNVYVADTDNAIVRKITPAGVVTTLAGQAGQAGNADGTGAAAGFAGLRSLAVDGAGNVYVADSDNGRIRRITPAGVVTTVAGSAAP